VQQGGRLPETGMHAVISLRAGCVEGSLGHQVAAGGWGMLHREGFVLSTAFTPYSAMARGMASSDCHRLPFLVTHLQPRSVL